MEKFLDQYAMFIPFVLFALIAVLAIYFGIKSAKATKKKLQETAMRLGLKYEDSSGTVSNPSGLPAELAQDPRFASMLADQKKMLSGFMGMIGSLASTWKMTGSFSGRAVDVHPETRGSGKNSTTYTILRVFFKNPVGAEMHLTREGFFAKVGKALLHSQDIQINDPEFDGKVMVKGKDEVKVKGFLQSPTARKAVTDYLAEYPGGVIDDLGIYCEVTGVITDELRYRSILDRMNLAANALER